MTIATEKRNPQISIIIPCYNCEKTLREAEAICGDHYTNVGRELTKIHEEVFRGRLSEAQKHFIGERQRGEFVIIIDTK